MPGPIHEAASEPPERGIHAASPFGITERQMVPKRWSSRAFKRQECALRALHELALWLPAEIKRRGVKRRG